MTTTKKQHEEHVTYNQREKGSKRNKSATQQQGRTAG